MVEDISVSEMPEPTDRTANKRREQWGMAAGEGGWLVPSAWSMWPSRAQVAIVEATLDSVSGGGAIANISRIGGQSRPRPGSLAARAVVECQASQTLTPARVTTARRDVWARTDAWTSDQFIPGEGCAGLIILVDERISTTTLSSGGPRGSSC